MSTSGKDFLSLSKHSLEDSDVEILAASFERFSDTTALDLSKNAITNAGIKMLTQVLQDNTTLRYLDLSHNRISLQGFIELASFLERNATLTTLKLEGNEMPVLDAEVFLTLNRIDQKLNKNITLWQNAAIKSLKEMCIEAVTHFEKITFAQAMLYNGLSFFRRRHCFQISSASKSSHLSEQPLIRRGCTIQ